MTKKTLIGWILTLITGKKPFPLFMYAHLIIHHPPQNTGTMKDEGNTPYLVNLGFIPGQNIEYYRKRLLAIMVSPSFYWNTFCDRIIQLTQAPLAYQIAVVGLVIFCGIIMTLTHSWHIGLTWWILTQLGTYPAALLQQLVEHDWWSQPEPNADAKSLIVNKSLVLYLASYPPRDQNILAWLRWFAQMGLNILIRMTFLPVTLTAHALHHALPNNKDWANQVYNLRAFQQGKVKGWKNHQFKEVWGFKQALDYIFWNCGRSR